MPRALAQRGLHVLCAGNRYARNDTPLIMEKVAVDLGAYLRHAREVWGYEKIVLCGWSGGGPLALFYQSQAQHPTVTATPAGEPYDLTTAGLVPADAVIFQAANMSRASLLAEWLDPSVTDETDPERRIVELDIYDPRNPNQPPYSADYIVRYRAAQLARMRRRTTWVKETLARLKQAGGKELERGFVNHRTMADLRFMDVAVDPNDRKPRSCHLGDPETSNSGPAGLGRFSTLRSWLSQWSIDDSNVRGADAAARITVPLAVIVNSADDAAPAADSTRIFDAAASADKAMTVIKGATHYYQGQPQLLDQAIRFYQEWLGTRGLLG
jgi:dienelactone hydrolase